jgi:hypothetical protein
MNLSAKSVGQLLMLAVVLFFFSCKDETSAIGYPNPQSKFNVSYIEIPIESSVLLMDSLRTSNASGETNRLLVGKYHDDKFGDVTATAFSQYFTASTSKTYLTSTAVFDSVSIRLRFDFYTYGNKAITEQNISIYEIDKDLMLDSLAYYFNRSNTTIKPGLLGSKSFTKDPAEFKSYIDAQKDTTFTVSIPLENSFGERLFASATKYRDSQTPADSAFARYSEFIKEFKGIAIVPNSGDKIFGFTPLSTASRIILHYHDAENDSLTLSLLLSSTASYSKITTERGGTDLAGLTSYHTDYSPNSLRYIQSGTGILTKLDFKKFFEFADTIPNLLINSAEISISGTEPSTTYDPITSLNLKVLKDNNRLRFIAGTTDTLNLISDLTLLGSFKGYLGYPGSGGTPFTASGADRSDLHIVKSSTSDSYSGFMTLFLQQLFLQKSTNRYQYFALYPESPPFGKSVNRLAFDKNNIRLKIYYTTPTANPETP